MTNAAVDLTPLAATRSESASGLLEDFRLPARYLKVRRVLETALILLCSPVLGVICLIISTAIRLDSGGPVLFSQDRPGKDNKPFRIFKFRSMRETPKEAPTLTARGDNRLTRVGAFMRRYRLDELPQLWNVLKGEMSLIGPRPEPMFMSPELEKRLPTYACRRCMLPGITGLAQVSQGYTESIEEVRTKLEYDLRYVFSVSPKLDLKIMVRTVSTILTGFGSR